MNILSWIQFSVGTFSAILQQILVLRAAGVAPSVSGPALVAQAHTAPEVTDTHKVAISAAGAAAVEVANATPLA